MERGESDMQERNKMIVHAIEKGYSQHRVAKVLGRSQPAVYGGTEEE